MNILRKVRASEGVIQLSAKLFVLCFTEKSAGQFAIEKFSFLSYGFSQWLDNNYPVT